MRALRSVLTTRGRAFFGSGIVLVLAGIIFGFRDLTRFGVPIEGFRHPAPETLEGWAARLDRFFGTLTRGDVLVVTSARSLGLTRDDETRAIADLRQRGVIVKVLSHGERHRHDAPLIPHA